MVLRPQDKERGLEAVNQSRALRRRAMVDGRVRIREVATRFWLATFAGLIVFGIVYYRYAQGALAERKNALRARQRAVAVGMGDEAARLRDKLESWVTSLADAAPDLVAPDLVLQDVSEGPTIYVRIPLADAHSSADIRRAAKMSVRDGFTACLFVGRAGDPKEGLACDATSRCGPGELCNDWGVCAPPGHPYNLKLLNEAVGVADASWTERLDKAGTDYEVLALELDLDDAAKHEVPAAVELVRRSKYFTALVDEPPDPVLVAANAPDAGVPESPEERVQTVDHFVRIGIWDVARERQLVRLRLEAAGRFLSMGKRTLSVAGARSEQRQANNCALAVELRERVAAAPHDASGAPTGADAGVRGDVVAGE